MGRRLLDEDARQIKRWKAIRRHVSRLQLACQPGDLWCRTAMAPSYQSYLVGIIFMAIAMLILASLVLLDYKISQFSGTVGPNRFGPEALNVEI